MYLSDNKYMFNSEDNKNELLLNCYKHTNKDLFLTMNSFIMLSFAISFLIGMICLLIILICMRTYPDIDFNCLVVLIASLLVGVINFTVFTYIAFIIDTIRCKINSTLLQKHKDIYCGYIQYVYDFTSKYYTDSKLFLSNIFVGSWIFNFIIATINDFIITDIYFIGIVISSFVFAIFSTVLFSKYINDIHTRVKNEYNVL